ncbi:MAG: hypothetical protein J3Q66DRAFT_394318 [Benniella sp.]|nr:MAG: hypothetical protein J3Q66DRAFT_394318 [Benniella sp.]
MEHTDKDHTEISRSTTQTSSKTIAMALPEILYNVFTFLDRPSLLACLQVSRVWYTQGRVLAWRSSSLSISRFMDITFHKPKDISNVKQTDNDKLQGFMENCHHIRSLSLIANGVERRTSLASIDDHLSQHTDGLRNLVYLTIQFPNCPWETHKFYCLTGAVVAQNPGIQELDLQTNNGYFEPALVDDVLRRMNKRLKKLSISGNFSGAYLSFLKLLIKKNEGRQEQQPENEQEQQEREQARIAQALRYDGLPRGDLESHCGDHNYQPPCEHDYELEELVLRDIFGYDGCHDSRAGLDLKWLKSISGELPIRALTLVNFATHLSDNSDNDSDYDEAVEEDGTLLPILNKCPHLEKLCVSFDLHSNLPENSPRYFFEAISKDPHYSYNGDSWIQERDDFVKIMYNSCPKLREIEFGMFYQLSSRHWLEMMGLYGSQLESLSIWGSVSNFNSEAFVTFMVSSMFHPKGDQLHGLTRLNINGMGHLRICAWMAFYKLPSLKEFRARDVSFNAKDLINKDGWICKGIEVLEIMVHVPKEIQQQCDVSDVLDVSAAKRIESSREDNDRDENEGQGQDQDQDQDQGENEDDQAGAKCGSKRRLTESVMTIPPKRVKLYTDDHKRIQIKVCEQLGRLTRLRELRIDGKSDIELVKEDRGCLELTMETGLDRLAPLQQNLEKLVVSGLDEGLGGRKEVEWIARNWVHYNNSRWLEQQHLPPTASDAQPSSSSQAVDELRNFRPMDLGSDAPFVPSPKFKALIGISENAENAASNIMWLKEQCPSLSVVKVDSGKK